MTRYKSGFRTSAANFFAMLAEHPALHTTLLIGGGGVALMIANVLYAKLLDPESFGRLVLMQAIAFVAQGLLPLGFESLIARREIHSPLPIIAKVLGIGTLFTALLLSVSHWIAGPDSLWLLALVFIAGTSGAAVRLLAAIEQSELRFLRSQAISQAPALLFLLCATMSTVVGISSWLVSGAAFALSYVGSALVGYLMVRRTAVRAGIDDLSALGPRAFALVGILASLLLLNQMPLFVAGSVLGLREVGILGLATTLIASPFRLLSHGVGYTLLPRMAACKNRKQRRVLLVQEFAIALGVAITGACLLYLLVPPLVEMLFGDQYHIPTTLIVALIALGLIRLNTAVVSAAINALANTATLHVFNISGWISAAVAIVAAIMLSDYGATGIVAGVAAGWIVRILFAGILIRKEL